MNWLKTDRPIFAWIPSLIWGSVILLFSVLPLKNVFPLTIGYFDKLAHTFEYTLLSFLLMKAFYRQRYDFPIENVVFTLILAGGYGIVMELLQLYVPGREANLVDVVFNLLGVIIGILLGRTLWRK